MDNDDRRKISRRMPDDEVRLPKWHILKDLPELYALLVSMFSICSLAAVAIYLNYVRDGVLFRHVWQIIVFHITGGALFGALKGAGFSGLTILDNIAINGLMACIIIFGFNAIFTLSCRGLLHAPWLKRMLSTVKSGARSQKKNWVKFGVPGIFTFVLFPLTGTGPVIGSVLGRLIGLGFWTNLFTVLTANLTTVIAVAFVGERFAAKLGDKTLSRIVFAVIALLILSALIAKVLSWRRNRRVPEGPEPTSDDDGVMMPRESSDFDFLDEEEKNEFRRAYNERHQKGE